MSPLYEMAKEGIDLSKMNWSVQWAATLKESGERFIVKYTKRRVPWRIPIRSVDHYENPRNVGSLPKDDPNVGTGLVGAPECGDVMRLQMKINPETQVIEDAKFKTFGCGSAIASSSLATEWVKGKTVDEAWPSRTRTSCAS